ncbi:MAG: GGDEF domain-containing protein, partial [Coriobacteriales bacterium]|nr:GGDEF domain-containing protein [Coriobacteriales bacterium]
LEEAIHESRFSQRPFSIDVHLLYGYGLQIVSTHIVGHTQDDEEGTTWLYMLVMMQGSPQNNNGVFLDEKRSLTFEYYIDDDKLVIHTIQSDGSKRDTVIKSCMKILETRSDLMSHESLIKASALARDLRFHSVTGFVDLKCNLRGGDRLRWYHINYSCEQTELGTTTVVHGYAQDANDSMGSTRWWRHQAESDQLTGLLNRNAVAQQINHCMHMYGSGMMFMIDLDGFKRVNDELGHLTGDMLLRDVATALTSLSRTDDLVGRYGGDEFVFFVPVNDDDARQQAQERAQEIIDAVGSIDISDGSHVACSVGVAISHNQNATFYDLLEVADYAMYESKSAGKGTYTITDL